MSLFATKPISQIVAEAEETGTHTFKKTLSSLDLTMLGIVVKDDGGLLFALAVTVFMLSALVLAAHRRELPVLGAAFSG